jgi:hypothetical protein
MTGIITGVSPRVVVKRPFPLDEVTPNSESPAPAAKKRQHETHEFQPSNHDPLARQDSNEAQFQSPFLQQPPPSVISGGEDAVDRIFEHLLYNQPTHPLYHKDAQYVIEQTFSGYSVVPSLQPISSHDRLQDRTASTAQVDNAKLALAQSFTNFVIRYLGSELERFIPPDTAGFTVSAAGQNYGLEIKLTPKLCSCWSCNNGGGRCDIRRDADDDNVQITPPSSSDSAAAKHSQQKDAHNRAPTAATRTSESDSDSDSDSETESEDELPDVNIFTSRRQKGGSSSIRATAGVNSKSPEALASLSTQSSRPKRLPRSTAMVRSIERPDSEIGSVREPDDKKDGDYTGNRFFP